MCRLSQYQIDQTRQVSRDKAEDWARRKGMLFLESSAKTKEGIDQVFTEVIQQVRRWLLEFLVTSRTLALLLCTWQHYSYITKKRNGVQSANCVYDFSVTLLRFSRIQRCWSTHDLIKAQTREGRTYERMQLLKTVDRRSAVAKKRSE